MVSGLIFLRTVNRGDKVYIDPEKIKNQHPEKVGEYKDYFYKTYLVGFVLSNEFITATPIGDSSESQTPFDYKSPLESPYTQVILDSSMISHV